ncbi:MAG: YlmC/YmxH family sporulation protein [Oscillospiraceae bacterium]|nr:YlmC/YmxH family sporulation protein [Oscillospiraceae bacterium]
MNYTLSELKSKEVIDLKSGAMLGRVDDVEIGEDSSVQSMIVYGRPKLFGFLGRDQDLVIDYKDISLIGRDAILISSDFLYDRTIDTYNKGKFLSK